jgi:hypothetical protein
LRISPWRERGDNVIRVDLMLRRSLPRDPGIVPAAPPRDLPPEPAKPGPFHHGLVGRLRNYFLTGLILVRF